MSQLPEEIQKACTVLGITPDQINTVSIEKACTTCSGGELQKAMLSGSDPDMIAISNFNKAKETLLEWLKKS
jgi:diaminopimelate decarboxylase